MYHTWHPGQDGEDNYLGPHDGRHMSTTALDALISGRTMPLEENESIKNLRLATDLAQGVEAFRIATTHFISWQKDNIRKGKQWVAGNSSRKIWHGFVVDQTADGFVAYPRFLEHPDFSKFQDQFEIHASTEVDLHERLDDSIPFRWRLVFPVVTLLTYVSRALGLTSLYLQRRWGRLTHEAYT